jgi:hypothetical protein
MAGCEVEKPLRNSGDNNDFHSRFLFTDRISRLIPLPARKFLWQWGDFKAILRSLPIWNLTCLPHL